MRVEDGELLSTTIKGYRPGHSRWVYIYMLLPRPLSPSYPNPCAMLLAFLQVFFSEKMKSLEVSTCLLSNLTFFCQYFNNIWSMFVQQVSVQVYMSPNNAGGGRGGLGGWGTFTGKFKILVVQNTDLLIVTLPKIDFGPAQMQKLHVNLLCRLCKILAGPKFRILTEPGPHQYFELPCSAWGLLYGTVILQCLMMCKLGGTC